MISQVKSTKMEGIALSMPTQNGNRQSVSLVCSVFCLLAPLCGHAQDSFQEAETYWREGDMQKVVWTYQKELSKPLPDNERVLFLTRLAMAQMASGDLDTGMAAYQEISQSLSKN